MEKRKQNWIVKRYLAGMPTKNIAAHLQISVSTTNRVVRHYKNFGSIMVSRPIGRPKLELNVNCKKVIKHEWLKFQCGSVKLHKILS